MPALRKGTDTQSEATVRLGRRKVCGQVFIHSNPHSMPCVTSNHELTQSWRLGPGRGQVTTVTDTFSWMTFLRQLLSREGSDRDGQKEQTRKPKVTGVMTDIR